MSKNRNQEIRELFWGSLEDAISDWLYYGRKGDEELSCDDVVKLMGEVSEEEIVAKFREFLHAAIEENFPES